MSSAAATERSSCSSSTRGCATRSSTSSPWPTCRGRPGRIHIRHGKGRKQRVVPFGNGPDAALRDYVDRFRGENVGPLFLTISRLGEPRRPMNKYLFGTLFSRLGERAGVHANPHRFRHMFATWAIENHARELDVQYLLGHSTSAMVRCYSETYDAAKAADAHDLFSPAARLLASEEAVG